ncbi:MAG: hypothetical protein ACKVHO_03820 [Verrucomicrobiia bacterium]
MVFLLGGTDPLAAIMEFEPKSKNFDLVLTDLSMPKLAGNELAQRIP